MTIRTNLNIVITALFKNLTKLNSKKKKLSSILINLK